MAEKSLKVVSSSDSVDAVAEANPTGSRKEGERIANAALRAAVQEVYRNAHKEGTRRGRALGRKALFSFLDETEATAIVAGILPE